MRRRWRFRPRRRVACRAQADGDTKRLTENRVPHAPGLARRTQDLCRQTRVGCGHCHQISGYGEADKAHTGCGDHVLHCTLAPASGATHGHQRASHAHSMPGAMHSDASRAAGRLRPRRGNGRVQHGMTRMRAARMAVQRDLAGMKILRPLPANLPLPACQGQQRLVDWRQAEIRRLVFAVVRRASSVTAREK